MCKLVFYLLKKILKPQLKHQRRQQQQPFPTTKGYNNLVIWSSWVRLKSWKHGNLKKTIFTVQAHDLLLYPLELNENRI